MITIENLTKTFGKKKALDNLSVTLEPGVIGLLGPNGSGKTTLLRTLTAVSYTHLDVYKRQSLPCCHIYSLRRS